MKMNETADSVSKLRAKMPSTVTGPPRMGYDLQERQMSSSWGSHSRPPSSAGGAVLTGRRPRSALKTRLDILETVRDEGPSRQSKIITRANLSQERSVKYLEELVSRGLLAENRDSASKSFALTAKGLDFVNQLKEVEALVAAFGLAI